MSHRSPCFLLAIVFSYSDLGGKRVAVFILIFFPLVWCPLW
jgi:hypothetical protein